MSREKLFPEGLTSREWHQFEALGYSKEVTGFIHRKEYPATCGIPLGGLGTGCIDLETSGLFGYYTIFNSHVPRGGPMNYPFLGLSVDDTTWVLTTGETKKYVEYSSGLSKPKEHEWSKSDYQPPSMTLEGCEKAKDIHYWGHYPIVDIEYEIEAPVEVALRAWSPFFPGNRDDSLLPGAVFEVHIRNKGTREKAGTLAFSFGGPVDYEAGSDRAVREHISGKFNGLHVKGERSSFVVGVLNERDARFGRGLQASGEAWSSIHQSLPLPGDDDFSASMAVDFSLPPEEEKVVRFFLTWYSPHWLGRGNLGPATYFGLNEHTGYITKIVPASSNFYKNMYATVYTSAVDAARKLAERHEDYLRRIISWQEVVYGEETLPPWLRDSLINILHLITEDAMWAAAEFPIGEWCRKEDGLFGLNECPRGCPQIECIPCSFYGNIPVVYFFPDAALSTLRGYKAYQFSDGAATWIFGGVTDNTGPVEMVYPTPGYQTTLNGPCYVEMVYRVWECRGKDKAFLDEFFESVKKNTRFTMNLRPEYEKGMEVISMPSGNFGSEWFEARDPGWSGMVTHVGGLHLANLVQAEEMAMAAGDQEFANECRELFKAGSKALEKYLWNGECFSRATSSLPCGQSEDNTCDDKED